jgi:exopolysaccharide biosynthesis WecB/TagA/CpsF family protein
MGFIKSKLEVQNCVDFVIKTQAPLVFSQLEIRSKKFSRTRLPLICKPLGVGLCIGASIDFLTGKQRCAPVWLHKAGLEWLYRLLSDPQRLARRYLIECPRVFYFIWL